MLATYVTVSRPMRSDAVCSTFGLEVFVEPLLHELAVLIRDAALRAPVDEIERAIERHADPDGPSQGRRGRR